MSPTEGTGRIPKPMRYRRYSARVQLVPRGMGAQTSRRKALPSGAAMAAFLKSMRPRLPRCGFYATNRGAGSLLVSYSR